MFLKGDPQGDLSLRKAIRDYLHTARGVNCSPAQIVIGAGNEYLLMLLSQLLGQKTGIAMENPTYGQAFRVLFRHGPSGISGWDGSERLSGFGAFGAFRRGRLCHAVPSIPHGDRDARKAEAGAAFLGRRPSPAGI